jgi:hypothetical protein
MSTPANVQLLITLDGGPPQSGKVTAAHDDVVVLKLASTSGVKKAKYRIRDYPEGFACPAGWTNENGRYVAVTTNGADAPPFTLPAALYAEQAGKYAFDVEVNDRRRNGAIASDLYYKHTNLEIPFPTGVEDVFFEEEDEFEEASTSILKRSWTRAIKALVRRYNEGLPGTGDMSGPASSVSGRIALMSGTSGKLIAQSARSIAEIQRTDFNVVYYGASTAATGATNRAAFNAAIVAANAAYVATGAQQVVLVPPGRYRLEPSASSSWNLPLYGSTAQMHIAVNLLSGVTIIFDEAEIVAVPPAGADSSWYYALFGTALNMTVGTLKSVKLLGLRMDFTTVYWTSDHTNLVGIVAVGVDDLEVRDVLCVRTAGTAGATGRIAKVMNCKRVKLTGPDARDISQAVYLNYCSDVEIRGRAEGTHEGFDIDQPCQRVKCFFSMINGTGNEQQCADIAGVTDGYFELFCENIGQAFNVYTKPDCHPTFADWVTKFPTATNAVAPVHPKRVKIVARGKNIHSSRTRAGQVSNRRDDTFGAGYWNGTGIATDITLDVAFEDSDPVVVFECENLTTDIALDYTNLDGEAASANNNNFALILRSEHVGGATVLNESKLSGRVRATIRGSERGGILVLAPTDLELEANIDGYNSIEDATSNSNCGLRAERLAAKPGVFTYKNLRIKGGDLAPVVPVDVSISNDSATGATGYTRLRDLGGHRLSSGGTPMSVASSPEFQGQKTYETTISIDTTTATNDIKVKLVKEGGLRLLAAYATSLGAITGTSGTNYTSLSMRRIRAGVTSSAIGTDTPYDNANRAAWEEVSLQVDGTDADGVFIAGDHIAVRASKQGAGSSRANIQIRLVFAEYSL